jgi:STE24 endopeptidase
MRWAIGLVSTALAVIFVLTMFVQFPAAREQAERYFSSDTIEIGWQYSWERRWLFWGSTAVHFAFLMSLVYLGFGRRLATWAARPSRGSWFLTLVVVSGACFLLEELLRLPFRLAGLEVQRRFGMTVMTWPAWFEDFAKAVGLNGLVEVAILVGLYLLMAWLPRIWWFVAAVASSILACFFALILPIWINPLFNEFRPLNDPIMEQRVRDLASRAGVPVYEVLVMDASRRSLHTNAYFTGFGSTRRIVLYDTLISTSNADQLESVLAHEIGHWQHDHIVKGIALGSVAAFVGLFLLSRILRYLVGKPPLYLSSPTDPAGIPLILLLFSLGNWLVMPVENAVSRAFERQADWTALELTRDPQSFIDSEKSMARTNLQNVAPNPIAVWYFSTHPTPVERIEMAERWRQENVPNGH